MNSRSRKAFRRIATVFAALGIAAPAAFASSTSSHQTIVHAHMDRSGTVVVTGYDGGAPLAP